MHKQSDKPLVSIVIPVFNSASYLADTIRSALAQTWQNTEILIIDDGSTDSSLAIAREFKNDKVKVYRQKNQGACAARNRGISESKGSFIQFLDADDLLSPNKIEYQIRRSVQLPPDTLLSCPWAPFTHSIDQATFKRDMLWEDTQPLDWLLLAWNNGLMMQTACWLTPKNVITRAGYWDESLKQNPNDDGEFFCRVILQSAAVSFTESSKVYYRTYSGSRVSQNKSRQAVMSLLETFESYENHVFKKERSPRTLQAILKNYSYFMYRYYEDYPDLALRAEKNIARHQAGFQPFSPSRKFSLLTNTIGFKGALKARSFLKEVFG